MIVDVRGIEEFNFALRKLGRQGENMARRAIRRAVKPMVQAYKTNAATYSRTIAQAIGVIQPRGKKILFGVGVRKKKHPEAWYAHIVEFGAQGIKRKSSPGGRFRKSNPSFAWVGKKKKGERYRVDLPPRPFAKPAIQQTQSIVEVNLGKEMNREFERVLKS